VRKRRISRHKRRRIKTIKKRIRKIREVEKGKEVVNRRTFENSRKRKKKKGRLWRRARKQEEK